MTGRMPAERQRATASATSGRGGSIMPSMPTKIKFCSSSLLGRAGIRVRIDRRGGVGRSDTPRLVQRRADERPLPAPASRWRPVFRSRPRFVLPSRRRSVWLYRPSQTCWQTPRMLSTAPFVNANWSPPSSTIVFNAAWAGRLLPAEAPLTCSPLTCSPVTCSPVTCSPATCSPRTRCTVVIRLRSESNGTSATRGNSVTKWSLRSPSRAAATTKSSLGRVADTREKRGRLVPLQVPRRCTARPQPTASPATGCWPRGFRVGRFAVSAAAENGWPCCSGSDRSSRSPATSSTVTVMRFSVSVPVLSEQITVTEPSVSTAGSLRISARRLNIRSHPGRGPP